MLKKHIILIGMRGAGKTFYAQKLAQKLQIPFVDTDALIQESEQMTIQDMVSRYGWEYFREKEYQVFSQIIHASPVIVATGGGLPLSEKNQELLKGAYVVWIYSPIKDILSYLEKKSSHRPALTDKNLQEEVISVYKEREPVYKSLSQYTLHAENSLEEELKTLVECLYQAEIY